MSTDLQWLLLRNYNSFLVKKTREGPIFSTEPGNLRNLHSHKYSGLSNTKTIDIQDSPTGIKVTVAKSKATPRQVNTARTTFTIRNRSGGRRSFGVVAGLAKKGYRPDLRAAALARTSALIAAQKEKKARPPKKARGKKAAAAAAAA